MSLTVLQAETLTLFGGGYTPKQIARMRGVRPQAVHALLEKARNYYGAATHTATVVAAVREQDIALPPPAPPALPLEADQRRCVACGITKPATADFFRAAKRCHLGLTHQCKACLRAYDRSYKRRHYAPTEAA